MKDLETQYFIPICQFCLLLDHSLLWIAVSEFIMLSHIFSDAGSVSLYKGEKEIMISTKTKEAGLGDMPCSQMGMKKHTYILFCYSKCIYLVQLIQKKTI